MLTRLFKRGSRRRLVVEFNPYQILVAEIVSPHRGAVVLDRAAEFDRDDADGLRRWTEGSVDGRKEWMTVICGVVPRRNIMRRESLQPRQLAKPGYLAELVEHQNKNRFLSASPFKITEAAAWTLRAVSAVDGTTLPAEGGVRPALICGMATEEVLQLQEHLLEHRLMPDRIEPGLLSLFGIVYRGMERRGDTRAVVIVVIHPAATAVYILGKEGVHTPSPVGHGFASILEVARKDFGLKEDAEARSRLENADRELINHGPKLVRHIARDLKPVVDSYEMTTGQPVDEIFCGYLPPKLGWIADALAKLTGRTSMVVDSAEWLPAAGLQVSPGGPGFGPHWLGALSLVSDLSEVSGLKSDRAAGEDGTYHRPWHVDCRLAAELADHRSAGRRILAGAVAATLAVLALAFTSWQLYASSSLRRDALYWEQQMAENRKLFTDLTAANAGLKSLSARLATAHSLMATPYQHTDLILSLGRTIPPHMRIDRIETNDARIALGGSLLEPAEEASGTLGNYMEALRRNPAVGPLFSSIAITSLQRKESGDAVLFEITLRLNPMAR